jgi:hypothetical protein
MKIISFYEIRHNRYFWLYFLSVCFPLDMDENQEIPLCDYIYENFDCGGEADAWVNKFVQFSEEIMEKHDGYAENPTAVQFSIGDGTFTVQFHPGDTVFYHNDKVVGSTGGHYRIHNLSFAGFQNFAARLSDSNLAILMLPLIYVTEQESDAARAVIETLLIQTALPEQERKRIADMILRGFTE